MILLPKDTSYCTSIFGDRDFIVITEHWISSRIEQLSHSHIGISCYRLFRAKQTYFLWIIHAFKAQSIVWWVFFNESLWNRHIAYNIQHFVKRGGWQCTPLDLLLRSGQKVHVSWYIALHSAKRVQFLRSTWRLHTYLDLLYLLTVIQVKFYQRAWQDNDKEHWATWCREKISDNWLYKAK